jgi:predicted  nucleic acid-binding Zn-ribbon protein
LKRKQEKLRDQLEEIQGHVNQKEALIKIKEEEKSALKAQIEDESRNHEKKFSRIRNDLEETKMLIA